MPLRIKVDEDLPVEVAGLLRAAGHDTRTVVEQGMSGTPDEQLWEFVQREQRCVMP
jgi:predicted nuclease of predicted toxin-antitoxin system